MKRARWFLLSMLVGLSQTVRAQIASSINPTAGGTPVDQYVIESRWYANSFTTTTTSVNIIGYDLTELVFAAQEYHPTTTDKNPPFAIYNNRQVNGKDVPGNPVITFKRDHEHYTWRAFRDYIGYDNHPVGNVRLNRNTKYWVVARSFDTDENIYHPHWVSHNSPTTGQWEIGNRALRATNVSGGSTNDGNISWHNTPRNEKLEFSIYANPVNSPYVINTFSDSQSGSRPIGGQGKESWIGARRRGISFFTRDSYYKTIYDVDLVVVKYDRRVNADPYGWFQAWIHEDNFGKPGRRSVRFSSLIEGRLGDGFRRFRHHINPTGPSRKIKSNTYYWLVFDADTSVDSDRAAYLRVAVSQNRGGSILGWKIERTVAHATDKRGFDDVASGDWSLVDDDRYPLQFGLEVDRELPDPFEIGDRISPGNLGEANVSSSGNDRNRGINNWSWVATRFWTVSRSGTPPHKFRLDHVTMLNNIRSYQNYNDGNHVIAIYDDDRSGSPPVPGNEIGRFSQGLPEIIQGNFAGSVSSDNNQQHRFHADPNLPILLNPWTGYWLVQKMENWSSGVDSVTHLGVPSFTRSKNADGWSMGDYYFRTHNRGGRWLEVNEDHGAHNDWTMRFGFGATVVVDPDLGDINVDGSINVFDLVLINDHIGYSHSLPRSIFYLGNLNADSGSSIINHHDRNLLLDLILEK